MAGLSGEQVAQILAQAGFSGRQLVEMVGIAKRESGWTPSAHRTTADPSKMVGDLGLLQINYTNVPALIKAGIIRSNADLLDPVKNAKAAYFLSKQGTNLSPWAAVQGKGFSAGGNPLAGVYLGPAQAAVESATAKGMLGQAYVPPAGSPGAGGTGTGAYPTGTGTSAAVTAADTGPKLVGAEERDAFNKYLKSLPADQQTALIADLKKPRTLGEVGAYMAQAPDEVNRYIKYLGTLDAAGQYGEKSLLAAPDPAGSKQMTDLLQTLGVSYPNAPNPTPALLAFLNGIGLNMSTAEDVKRRAIERIGASTSDAMAEIDRQAGRTKQNITGDLVRRGVLSSGESNTRYAKQAEDVGKAQSDVTNAKVNATDSAETAYTQARDLARQQALDRIIGAEQSQASSTAASAANVDATNASTQAANDAAAQQKAAQDAALKAQQDAIARAAAQGVAV